MLLRVEIGMIEPRARERGLRHRGTSTGGGRRREVDDAVRADSPASAGPGEAKRQRLLDELDDARINGDLLALEVEADKAQIQRMMTVLRETELMAIQGFSQGPVIGGSAEKREEAIDRYRQKLDQVSRNFVIKSKELSRERRRVADLEAQLGLAAAGPPASPAAAPRSTRAVRSLADAERVLDLILRGVESWQRGNAPAPDERTTPPPSPSPTPGDRPLKDAERLLDLIRRGIESWRGDSPKAPEERPAPEAGSEPDPAPEERGLKDAERLLDLIRRGIESWKSP
jgi:hypothetical protein